MICIFEVFAQNRNEDDFLENLGIYSNQKDQDFSENIIDGEVDNEQEQPDDANNSGVLEVE
jgi:hypothetical protein